MSVGNKMFNGMVWSFIQRISVQFFQLLLGIVLTRLLLPTEYGTLGILMVFIAFSRVFVDSGFSKALIHKKNRSTDDISTVFLFNLAIAILCYILLWFCAPLIGSFYAITDMPIYLRIISIVLIIDAAYAIPSTLFTINLDFKSLTKVNLISVIVSGLIAIILAYNGFGVWALIIQVLVNAVVTAVLLWKMVSWKPTWRFSKSSFNHMFSYGSKLLASSLLSSTISNLNSLLIGKFVSVKDLGFFSRGTQFANAPYSMFAASIGNIILPGLAPIQDDRVQLKKYMNTIFKSTGIIAIPLFLLLAILAKPLVLFLFTDKWAMAIPILQIFAIARLITIFNGINMNLLYVAGRTDLALKQQYFVAAVRIALVLVALPFGIIYIAFAELAATSIHFFINAYHPGKIYGYTAFSQIRSLAPVLASGFILCSVGLGIASLGLGNLNQILLTSLIAPLIYLGSLRLFKVKELTFLKDKVAGLIKRN